MHRAIRASVLLALLVGLGACQREDAAAPPANVPAPVSDAASATVPFRISRIDLGSAVDAGKRIPVPAEVFLPGDTIYVSIVSEGASPSVALVVRWTSEDGLLVSEGSQVIAPEAEAATEFHISRPGGWPLGKYQVEVVANGTSAGVRSFEVRE